MTFGTYFRDWLERHDFIKSTRKVARQALKVYSYPVIGDKDLTEITKTDIYQIFRSKRLFR